MAATKKRFLLVAAVALAAGFVALFVFLRQDLQRGRGLERRSPSRAEEARRDALATETPADGSARARASAAAEPSTLPPTLPRFEEGSGLRIVVLATDTRAPVAGAEVHVRPDPTGSLSVFNLSSDSNWVGPDFEAFVKAGGKRFVTDANGEVELPPPLHPSHAIARLEDRFGWTLLDAGDGALVEIAVRRVHEVVVVVRDTQGAPQAGIGVAFGYCDGGAAFWSAPTDELGRVRIPVVEILMEEAGMGPLTAFSLRIDVPDLPRIERWMTVGELTGAPIELTLPATGSLQVHIVDDRGQVVPLDGGATLEPEWSDRSGRGRIDEPGVTRVDLVDGVATFPRVGLGQRFELEIDMVGCRESLSRRIPGPRLAGEHTTIEVPLEIDNALVRGRLVDEAGAPLAGLCCAWLTILGDGRSVESIGRAVFVTDADGRFARLARRLPQTERPVTDRIDYLHECTFENGRREARVRLPIEISGPQVELGDVTMPRTGPVLSGHVRDAREKPVANVRLLARFQSDGWARDYHVFEPGLSGEDGAFAIFGPCVGLPIGLGVHLESTSYSVDPPGACPMSGLVVHLEDRGGFEGTALIDHDALLDDFEIRFTRDEPAPADTLYPSWRRAGDRIGFRLVQERPGRGVLRFSAGEQATGGAYEVPGVVIPVGRVDRPRALVDVDLRGKLPKGAPNAPDPLESVEFTIVDPGGRVIPRGMIWGRQADGDCQFQRTFGGGRALVPRTEVDKCVSIEVWAPGCRATRLERPFTLLRITLLPEFAVEFRLAWPARWREARLELVGDISMVDTDPPQFQPAAFARMQPFRFDAEGRGRAHLMASGRFSIYTTLVREDVPGLEDIDYGIGLVQHEFTVRETDGVQVVELALDPEKVAQCNEDLGLK